MKFGHAQQINRAEHVDVVHNEGFFKAGRIFEEKMRSFLQAAASVKQHILARDFNTHAEVVVRLQILRDHGSEMMHIDNHFADAKRAEAGKRDLQQRAAVEFYQRFWTIAGEWTQPGAQAGG